MTVQGLRSPVKPDDISFDVLLKCLRCMVTMCEEDELKAAVVDSHLSDLLGGLLQLAYSPNISPDPPSPSAGLGLKHINPQDRQWCQLAIKELTSSTRSVAWFENFEPAVV